MYTIYVQVANWHVHVHVGMLFQCLSVVLLNMNLCCCPTAGSTRNSPRRTRELPDTGHRCMLEVRWGRERGRGGRAREVGEGKGEGVREVGIQCNICPNLPSPQVW